MKYLGVEDFGAARVVAMRNKNWGVSIHDYPNSDLVGTGDAAIDDAAFAWLAANFPNRPWLLRAETTYTTAASIDISSPGFGGGLLGHAQHGVTGAATAIVGTNPAEPLLKVGGEAAVLADIQMFPAAGGVAVEGATDRFARATVDNINVVGGAKSFHFPAGCLFFNNVFSNVRCTQWTDVGIQILAMGTGSVFTNTYMHSSTVMAPLTNVGQACTRAIEISGGQTAVMFEQLNIEYIQCSASPIVINGGGTAVFTSMWVEGVQWPSHGEIVAVFGDRNHVDIRAFEAAYNFPIADLNTDPAETQAIFGVGGGGRLTVDHCMVRDNGGGAIYLLRGIDNNPDSQIWVKHFRDHGTVTGLPAHTAGAADLQGVIPQQAWAQPPAGALRQFNDDRTNVKVSGELDLTGANIVGMPSAASGSFTGDGTTTQFDLVHNLVRGAVVVALHNTTTNEVNPPGGPGITYVDDNTTRLTYATAPTAGHVYNWSAT